MSDERPMQFVRRLDATDYLTTEEDIGAFLMEAEARANGDPEILSAAQAVVRRARERHGIPEPEPEQCRFCGKVMLDPCETLPPDICEKAIQAGGRADES